MPAWASARASYLTYRIGAEAAQRAPDWIAAPGSKAAARVFATVMRDRRIMIERHLRRAHGGAIDDGALRRAVDAAFESYARYWLESFTLPRETAATLDGRFSYEGREHLDDALAAGAGAILALPHLGGWDYAGAWLATHGYPLTVVVERVEPPELFEWFAAHRRSLGMQVVPLGDDVAPATAAVLRTGGLLALLCDRDIPGTGIEVELFGERTTLPGGPAMLALRTGAPLLPTASYFCPRGRHLGVVKPPMAVERRGSLRDDVARITQDLARELEALIVRAPEQWHLMQPNWPSDFELLGIARGAGARRSRGTAIADTGAAT